MGPCLKVTMVAERVEMPRVTRTRPLTECDLRVIAYEQEIKDRLRRSKADAKASVSEPEHQGLSPARNFPGRGRYGFKGLTPLGKRRVEEGSRILEMDRHLCTFWTATLPTAAYLRVVQGHGSTSELTDALMQGLAAALRARHLPEEIVGVIEIQEKRWRLRGEWVPHWHLVFQTRRHRRGRRALDIAALDGVWRNVVLEVTGFDLWTLPENERKAACKTEPIKKTVGGYLRKYMRKGATEAVLSVVREVPPRLVPGQWFCMSRPLLGVIKSLTGRLSATLLLYINKMEKELVNDGLLFARWRGKLEGVPPMVTYYFPALDALAAIVARWQADDPRSHLPARTNSTFLWI